MNELVRLWMINSTKSIDLSMYVMYDMYMIKEYTVSEFRDNMREALNHVEAGGKVLIKRHNKVFAIIEQAAKGADK